MANGQNSAIVKAVLSFVYRKVINYIKEHPELSGYELRLKIRRIFGTSLSADQLDRLLAIARSRG